MVSNSSIFGKQFFIGEILPVRAFCLLEGQVSPRTVLIRQSHKCLISLRFRWSKVSFSLHRMTVSVLCGCVRQVSLLLAQLSE